MMSRPTSTETSWSYLKDHNVFMERLLTMLNQGLVSKDLREFARFKDVAPGTHHQA